MKTTRRRPARLNLREIGERELRRHNPDDGFGYLGGLKREARAMAKRRLHELGKFKARRYAAGIVWDAHCTRCRRLIVVHGDHVGAHVIAPIYGPVIDKDCDR